MIESFITALLHFVDTMGYIGLFIMAALESTFLPIPSEATMVPAGYLIYQGKMNAELAFISCVLGTLAGSLANYGIARYLGRRVLLRYQHILFINEEKLEKIEKFFIKHGPVSIFTGRLVFGVRHFISFPAGLAKMDLKKFCFYTLAGASIWVTVLLTLGYAFGGNEDKITHILPAIKVGAAALVIGFIFFYRRKKLKNSN